MSVAIAVMTKTPDFSPVKTRLASAVGLPFAVEVHRHSARATASVVAEAARCGDVAAYWAVAEAAPAAAAAWPAADVAAFELIHQCGGGLGERMGRLHSDLVARHGAALLVGTDSPQMEAEQLGRACDWLATDAPRLVLGPAVDGGFWLFGGNRPIPLRNWKRIPYSTQGTRAAFAAMIEPYGERLELPSLRDVDVIEDLEPLLGSLCRLDQATPSQHALRVWLEEQAR
ncbi:MAG: DUF2064 domain-containing protein [Xanthomonadales bacterium]|nr:DUF2064 domain-containing protein [Xanthomonadales bacterium]